MRIYLDSSAVLKRIIIEPESANLVAALDRYHADEALFVSSSLAWIEVARALRHRDEVVLTQLSADTDTALTGVAEHPITAEVIALARRVSPSRLRSLDAIHLASALLLDADRVLTYDARLADACVHNGLAIEAPGTSSP
jgi:predicted nucleic acid-binding protein